jgi:hypothetical protein
MLAELAGQRIGALKSSKPAPLPDVPDLWRGPPYWAGCVGLSATDDCSYIPQRRTALLPCPRTGGVAMRASVSQFPHWDSKRACLSLFKPTGQIRSVQHPLLKTVIGWGGENGTSPDN